MSADRQLAAALLARLRQAVAVRQAAALRRAPVQHPVSEQA
jgi:hypothetical protein